MGSSESKSSKKSVNKNTKNAQDFKVKTKLVQIIIELKSGKIWEKAFNVEGTLSQIESDFKQENELDTINKNYYIEWTYQNSTIEMNLTTIKQFIEDRNIDDTLPIKIHQEIRPKNEDKLMNYLEMCDVFAIPLFNPFKIFIVEKKQKLSISPKTYKNLTSQLELNKCSIDSAYCNGNNHLYISGGVDRSTSETLDLFWDIDLKSDNIDLPIKISPKKNHSMIYANRKVFMIGGNDEKTIIYDTENKAISNLCDLKMKRFEPSLIRHDNYLFCFDSSKKKNDDSYNFERLNLNNLENPSWEIIYPNISPNLGENVYCQKFFGLVEDYKQNIIFIGGIYDNSSNYAYEENNMKIMNTRYNIAKNLVEKSDIPFQEISLSEKTFLPFSDKIFFILPNFYKKNPEIIYYNRDKNEIQISSYKSAPHYKTKKQKNINPNLQIKTSLYNINFDMPGLHQEIDLHNNFINNNSDLNIVEPNSNNEITMKNSNLFNIGSSTQPFNVENNFNSNIIKEENSSNNKNNHLIEIISDSEKNISKEQKTDINNNIKERKIESNEDSININGKKAVNIDIYNYELKPEDNQFDNTNNLNSKLNLGKTKEQNENNDINNIKDIKISIDKEKKKGKNNQVVYEPQRSYRNYRIKFHNSVNDPCNVIERIKINNLASPNYISPKLIKRKGNKILYSEKKDLRINNY